MAVSSEGRNKVCGVMVTYRPDGSLFERLPALLAQLGHLVVVDNGSGASAIAGLETAAIQHGFTFIRNSQNNLAMAQNIGIRHAAEQGFSYVLLLDDDSIPAPDMVVELLKAAAAPSSAPLGVIAAQMRDEGSVRPIRAVAPWLGCAFRYLRPDSQGYLDGALHVIASGSLTPLAVLNQIGGMDEAFGIDYVDKEWCLRLQRAGYGIRVVSQAVLHHRIGDSRDHTAFGLRITTTNHAPERRYSIYRNRLLCWRRYGRAIPSFVVHDALGIAYDLLRVIGFESDKKAKLKAMVKGAWDALRLPQAHP